LGSLFDLMAGSGPDEETLKKRRKRSEMDNEELTARVGLIKPIFGIVRSLLEIQATQQTMLEGMRRTFGDLLAVLAGAGEPAASPTHSPAQQAAISTAQREIAELERLFSSEPTEGETL
jgi:hypothetical protein